ncbi:hypothetical protein [Hirschia litorea]|uniref:Uncharacterized protein n=1 Tax=Hirschia litorea TaxID=1199156 RepID=A0ABW2IPN6_9PROT
MKLMLLGMMQQVKSLNQRLKLPMMETNKKICMQYLLQKQDINLLDHFDDGWADRIEMLDNFRIKNSIPLREKEWLVICDLADELMPIPKFNGTIQLADEFQQELSKKKIELFKLYQSDLSLAKERLLSQPNLFSSE